MPPHATTLRAYTVTRNPKGVRNHFQKARSPMMVDLVHGILGNDSEDDGVNLPSWAAIVVVYVCLVSRVPDASNGARVCGSSF